MAEEELNIPCGTSLDIDSVTRIHGFLVEALEQELPVVLDLSDVGAFDTAGLQLLCAAARAAKARGHSLSFDSPRSDLSKAVKDLDLLGLLGDWPQEPGQPSEGA